MVSDCFLCSLAAFVFGHLHVFDQTLQRSTVPSKLLKKQRVKPYHLILEIGSSKLQNYYKVRVVSTYISNSGPIYSQCGILLECRF